MDTGSGQLLSSVKKKKYFRYITSTRAQKEEKLLLGHEGDG